MRDPNRIPEVLNELKTIWMKAPDWRLGQLFNNLQRYEGNDLFYYEDDKIIEALQRYIDSYKKGEII